LNSAENFLLVLRVVISLSSLFQFNLATGPKFGEYYIKVYPNPTSGKLNILTDEASRVSIYNVNAQLILNDKTLSGKENYSLDISHLNNGLYLVHIQQLNSGVVRIVRIFKE
jgi:hypothetical protein